MRRGSCHRDRVESDTPHRRGRDSDIGSGASEAARNPARGDKLFRFGPLRHSWHHFFIFFFLFPSFFLFRRAPCEQKPCQSWVRILPVSKRRWLWRVATGLCKETARASELINPPPRACDLLHMSGISGVAICGLNGPRGWHWNPPVSFFFFLFYLFIPPEGSLSQEHSSSNIFISLFRNDLFRMPVDLV